MSQPHRSRTMALPTTSVTIDTPQVVELIRHLSLYRHDVNGDFSVLTAALELVRYSPGNAKKYSAMFLERAPSISGKTAQFARQCERTLGIRPEGDSWYADLWSRHELIAPQPATGITLPAEAANALQNELLNLHRELMKASFIISGTDLPVTTPEAVLDLAATRNDQLNKIAAKFNEFAAAFERATGLHPVPKPVSKDRQMSMPAPAGPVTLSPERVALFQRRLVNLERDVLAHLPAIFELNRCLATPPHVPPVQNGFETWKNAILATITDFSAEFDATFMVNRKRA